MPGQPNRRDKKRREENQRKYRELVAMRDRAIKQGLVEHGIPPHEALQRLIDDAMLRYLEECAKNDQAREAGEDVNDGREERLRKAAAYFAGLAIQYGLEERRVRVEERHVALIGAALQIACAKLGIGAQEFKQVPKLLKAALDEIRDMKPDERAELVHRSQADAERPPDIEAA